MDIKMKHLLPLMLATIVALPTVSGEHIADTIDDLEREQFLLGGTVSERLERIARAKSLECMRAFPHREFCECPGPNLPMVLAITQYTIVVTSSREQLGYDELSSEERRMIETTRDDREQCATEAM